MKRTNTLRLLALILCLILSLSLLSTVFAADEIWIEEPLGWTDASQVIYKRVDGHLCNWGVRGETALFLSTMALSYYGDAEWGLTMGNTYAGGTGTDNATSSALYTQLHQFLVSKQTHQTSYDETKNLFQYTDCMVSNNAHTSSFYSGRPGLRRKRGLLQPQRRGQRAVRPSGRLRPDLPVLLRPMERERGEYVGRLRRDGKSGRAAELDGAGPGGHLGNGLQRRG